MSGWLNDDIIAAMATRIKPEIRQASLSDAAMLAELGERAFSEAFAEQNDPKDMADYLAEAFGPDKQASELADENVIFLIAEVNGTATGYVQLQSSEPPDCVTDIKPLELARIYVLREWLGKGIGDSLMESALARAVADGYATIWLGVWQSNGRALRFYEKWGFKIVGTHFFQLGSDRQTDHLMERSLTSVISQAS
jgi:ribosomal protein S18 acetylase RimI-like enzyme